MRQAFALIALASRLHGWPLPDDAWSLSEHQRGYAAGIASAPRGLAMAVGGGDESLRRAIGAIVAALTELGAPFMIIGGIAVIPAAPPSSVQAPHHRRAPAAGVGVAAHDGPRLGPWHRRRQRGAEQLQGLVAEAQRGPRPRRGRTEKVLVDLRLEIAAAEAGHVGSARRCGRRVNAPGRSS